MNIDDIPMSASFPNVDPLTPKEEKPTMTRYALTTAQAHVLAKAASPKGTSVHAWIESVRCIGATVELYATQGWFGVTYALGEARVGAYPLKSRRARRWIADNRIEATPC